MGGSTGVPGMALRPYPSSAPPVTNSSIPVQKLASEARNTAAAATSAGWPMRPRGWGETGGKGEHVKHLVWLPCPKPLPKHLDGAPTPTWARVPSRIVAAGSGVKAASSSHSGVQMFPGEMLRKGEEGVRDGCHQRGLWGSLPAPPS